MAAPHDVIGLTETPSEINDEVVRRLVEHYASAPLIAGAFDAMGRLAGSLRLALASSSNRAVMMPS